MRVVIYDDSIPLSDSPEEFEIFDATVPLGDMPETGVPAVLWIMVTGLCISLTGMVTCIVFLCRDKHTHRGLRA